MCNIGYIFVLQIGYLISKWPTIWTVDQQLLEVFKHWLAQEI